MIKLAVPDVGEEELNEIKKVFDSKYLVQGDKVEEFEELIEKYLNVKNAIAVSSGTAALHLALLAIGVGKDDEVIVPDFTFPATANVVECVGAVTKLVDIKLEDFCIDEDKVEKFITKKTKVIMPVQEFGQSCDMNKIMDLARKYNLKVIEDAACALGAEYREQKVGTIGDIGCFSLHPRKAITTGEGGIVVTNNDELAEKIRVLRNHGISYKSGKPEFVLPGFNYRMTNIQGAIGVAQMKKIENINKKRIKLANEYNEVLKNIKGIRLPKELNDRKHVWQTYHILLDSKIDRDKFIQQLREHEIESNFGAYSVHLQPYYANKYNANLNNKYTFQTSDFNNSSKCFKQGLALPLHFKLTSEDIELVKNILVNIMNLDNNDL